MILALRFLSSAMKPPGLQKTVVVVFTIILSKRLSRTEKLFSVLIKKYT